MSLNLDRFYCRFTVLYTVVNIIWFLLKSYVKCVGLSALKLIGQLGLGHRINMKFIICFCLLCPVVIFAECLLQSESHHGIWADYFNCGLKCNEDERCLSFVIIDGVCKTVRSTSFGTKRYLDEDNPTFGYLADRKTYGTTLKLFFFILSESHSFKVL